MQNLLHSIFYTGDYGTPALNTKSELFVPNISEALIDIRTIINDPTVKNENEYYYTYTHRTKLGELNIYQNGNAMSYIPT